MAGLLLLVACSEPLPANALAPDPPMNVQNHLRAEARIGFEPLTNEELAIVRITAAQARRIGLAAGGMGYGAGDDRVTWQKVGCIYLGYYTAPSMPSFGYVPPEFPAYLVQVFDDRVPDFPMINIGVVVVDARTGERSTTYDEGRRPTASWEPHVALHRDPAATETGADGGSRTHNQRFRN